VLVLCAARLALAGDFEVAGSHAGAQQSTTGPDPGRVARVTKLGQPVHLTASPSDQHDAADLTALVKPVPAPAADLPRGHRPDLQPAGRRPTIDSQGEAVVEMGGRKERLTQVPRG